MSIPPRQRSSSGSVPGDVVHVGPRRGAGWRFELSLNGCQRGGEDARNAFERASGSSDRSGGGPAPCVGLPDRPSTSCVGEEGAGTAGATDDICSRRWRRHPAGCWSTSTPPGRPPALPAWPSIFKRIPRSRGTLAPSPFCRGIAACTWTCCWESGCGGRHMCATGLPPSKAGRGIGPRMRCGLGYGTRLLAALSGGGRSGAWTAPADAEYAGQTRRRGPALRPRRVRRAGRGRGRVNRMDRLAGDVELCPIGKRPGRVPAGT
jgi:hypothetical protein